MERVSGVKSCATPVTDLMLANVELLGKRKCGGRVSWCCGEMVAWGGGSLDLLTCVFLGGASGT